MDVAGSESRTSVMAEKSPCLTRGRAGTHGHYLLPQRRMMCLAELEELQGIPAGHLCIPAGVTESQYGQMLGNAFTVPVAGRVAIALLKQVGKLPVDYPDVWAEAEPSVGFDFSRFQCKGGVQQQDASDGE